MNTFGRILVAVTILCGLVACQNDTRLPTAPLSSTSDRATTVQPTATWMASPVITVEITASRIPKVENHAAPTSTVMFKTTEAVSAESNATPFLSKHNSSKIAFMSMADGRTDIWSIDSDGMNRERLTNDSSIEWGLAWSPDGNTIAYASRPYASAMNSDAFWLFDIQNGKCRRLVNSGLDGVSAPSWSPDGHTIAYSTWVTDVSHIWLVDVDTGAKVEIFKSRASPLWSPQGGELAVDGPPVEVELGLRLPMSFFSIIRTDGEPLDHIDWGWDWIKQVTGMAWSHAGDRLLVTSEAGVSLPDTASLELVKVAGKTASIAVNHMMKCSGVDCDFYSPAWFPGDEEILFIAAVPLSWEEPADTQGTSEQKGKWWIYRATNDLATIQPVFESVLPISDASLSPDGTQIVFVQGKDSDAELWILELGTGQAVQLTDNDVYDGEPVWQPYSREED
jgi:Tol biopolymer transport system component